MKQIYYRHKLKNLLMINKIVTIHYFEGAKGFTTKGETHDFWELVYADKCSVVCTAGDKQIVLNEGEILFHKPNEYHALSTEVRNPPNVFVATFECRSEGMGFFENKRLKLDKSLLKFIYMLIEESRKTFDLPYSDPDLKKMPLRQRPTLGGQQLIKNLLEILLINIMRGETEKADANETFLFKEEFEGRVAKRIIELLEENVRENLSIDELCAKLNYNKSYLFRQFKATTGCSIMAYFINLKMKGAKKLLRESDMTVVQIANHFSFDSPNYFSKTFKKLTGHTPTNYRKIHKSKK